MGVSIPSNYNINLGGGLGVDLNAHIPSPFKLEITQIPKIQLGIDKVELKIDPLKIEPIDLSLRLKEIPSIRMHLPADFKIGMALLGYELLTVRLCGEAQVITEPYVQNPCEVCGGHLRDGNLITIDQADAVSEAAKT